MKVARHNQGGEGEGGRGGYIYPVGLYIPDFPGGGNCVPVLHPSFFAGPGSGLCWYICIQYKLYCMYYIQISKCGAIPSPPPSAPPRGPRAQNNQPTSQTPTYVLLDARAFPWKSPFWNMRRSTIPYILYHTIYTIPYHIYTTSYHTRTTPEPHQTVQFNTIPYHTTPYRTVPYHTIPYHKHNYPKLLHFIILGLAEAGHVSM